MASTLTLSSRDSVKLDDTAPAPENDQKAKLDKEATKDIQLGKWPKRDFLD